MNCCFNERSKMNTLTTGSTAEAAAVGGVIGGVFAVLGIFSVICVILLVIARWKLFTKAGEKGWKSIIPIYSDYTEWKIGWKKINLFWVTFALIVVAYILMSIGGMTVNEIGHTTAPANVGPAYIIGCLLLIPALILDLMAVFKLLKSFGKGAGWLVLYIFFPAIVLLILGFGSSKYTKPQE